jgi:hypothetical protein
METSPAGGIPPPSKDPDARNPFHVGNPLHEAFKFFTREAERQRFSFEAEAYRNRPTPWEDQSGWLFQRFVKRFEISLERDLCTVWDDKSARAYWKKWESILQVWFKRLEESPLPGVTMAALFRAKLRNELCALVKMWSAEALGQAAAIQFSVVRFESLAKNDLRTVQSRKDVPAYQRRLEAHRQELLKQNADAAPDRMVGPSLVVLAITLIEAGKVSSAKALERVVEIEAHAGAIAESTFGRGLDLDAPAVAEPDPGADPAPVAEVAELEDATLPAASLDQEKNSGAFGSDHHPTTRRRRPPSLWGRPVERWSDLRFVVVSSGIIQVWHGDSWRNITYVEFGLADRRGGRDSADRGPAKAWKVLLQFAEHRGVLSMPRRKATRSTATQRRAQTNDLDLAEDGAPCSSSSTHAESRIQAESRATTLTRQGCHIRKLRRVLQRFFEISDDPIPYEQRSYRLAFKISRARTL